MIGISTAQSIHTPEKKRNLSNGCEVKWDEKFKFTFSMNYTQNLQNEYLTIQAYCGEYHKINQAIFLGDLELDLYSLCVGPPTNIFELMHSEIKSLLKFQISSIQLAETIFKLKYINIYGAELKDIICEYKISGDGHSSHFSERYEKNTSVNDEKFYSFSDLAEFIELFTVNDFANSKRELYVFLRRKKSKEIISEFHFPIVQTYRNKNENNFAVLKSNDLFNGEISAKCCITIKNCPRFVQSLDGVRYFGLSGLLNKNYRPAQGTYLITEKPATLFDEIEPVCDPIDAKEMTIDPFFITIQSKTVN